MQSYVSPSCKQVSTDEEFFISTPVGSSLHVQWDRYGTFCFVPEESYASAMLGALHESNKKWTQLNPRLYPNRPLDVRSYLTFENNS